MVVTDWHSDETDNRARHSYTILNRSDASRNEREHGSAGSDGPTPPPAHGAPRVSTRPDPFAAIWPKIEALLVQASSFEAARSSKPCGDGPICS